MILRFLKRCFLVGAVLMMFGAGTVACCCYLACSPPRFYAEILAEPVDRTDVEAAMIEIGELINSMEVFVAVDDAKLKQLQAMPADALANAEVQLANGKVSLSDALKTLKNSQGDTPDTFVVSLTERQLNACLYQEFGEQSRDWRRPSVSLADDVLRCAVNVVTPVAELAVSCDLAIGKTRQTDLSFELQALRVGTLPLPATAILELVLKTKPTLPNGIALTIEGDYPKLTLTSLPNTGKILVDDVRVADGQLQVTFRRTANTVVAAN
ncbi:MAG: hypothetical protein AAGD11_09135 [Planctomycetota bacterium]